jgi:aspartate kinase
MKFGGTSVGSVERIQAVADRVVHARESGDDVIVVVSAMGDTTDDLTAMALEIADVPDPREMDMLLTAGERIAMSAAGHRPQRAWLPGRQLHGFTGRDHHRHPARQGQDRRDQAQAGGRRRSRQGNVVVLAGFQGLSTRYEITTLGRGASDLTAVAMAGAVGADVCEIYTDVDGV